jgi:nucleotide-binding universal stress UspA family protein
MVPLDGSERSLVALPVAKALAEIEGATIHVLHVCDRDVPARELCAGLHLAKEQLTGVVLDELTGMPAARIVELAGRIPDSMLVMAAHAQEVEVGNELGPVTEQVLANVSCPVVLVRPELGARPWSLKRILLPHDGSPVTAAGFLPAVRLAELAEAEILVLHVATLSGEPAPGSLPVPPYVDQPHLEWPEWTREFLERMEVFTDLPTTQQPRLFLSKGDPGHEILRFATEQRVDLIALSWHGSLERARAGTLKDVILNAPCPLLFAKAPTEEPRVTKGSLELREGAHYLHS